MASGRQWLGIGRAPWRGGGVPRPLPMHPCSQVDADDRLVIQIHGSTSDPQSIVLTREGYRSLLHLNPAYSNFLKTVMAGSTLLYMGFSFTDGYFNEIRSELMTLQVVGTPGGTEWGPAMIGGQSVLRAAVY